MTNTATARKPQKKMTKRDIESARKRKLIYEEAFKLFREYGYENTTLEDIREATGMSRGSIYHFFSKKIDILYRFFAEMTEEAVTALTIDEKNLKAPADALLKYTVAIARAYESLGYDLACHIQNIYQDTTDDVIASRAYLAGMREFIDAAKEYGTFNTDIDTNEAAHCIHIAAAGVFRKWILEEGSFSLGDATDWYTPYIINLFVDKEHRVTKTKKCPEYFRQN